MSWRLLATDTIRGMDCESSRGRAAVLRGFLLAALVGVALVVCGASASSGRSSSPLVNGRIAFVLHSDLFTVRPDGRGLMRLTSGRDVDDAPVWSPGGRWLAFSRTSWDKKVGSVYLVGERGGKPRLVLRGASSPEWSPNGRRLAVIRNRAGLPTSIWTVGSTGRDPLRALAGASDFDWSPSGHELAVLRSDGIWIVRVATGKARKVSGIFGLGSLDWSPDGGRLLLLTNDGIVTVSLTDGAVTTLRTQRRPAPGEPRPACTYTLGHAAWSPDGSWIAYEDEMRCTASAPDSGYSSFVSTIQIISVDGAWHSQLDNLVWGFGHDGGPSSFVWSPDSRQLAFIEGRWRSGDGILETADIAGTNHERLKAGLPSPPVALSWQRSPAR